MTRPLIQAANPGVAAIAPYQPGLPIEELARRTGQRVDDIVKLASNENPLGPSPKTIDRIRDAASGLALYPDGAGFALRGALAARHGVEPGQILLGNGSNDVLEMAAAAFLRPGNAALWSRYAFAVYPLATQARGARGIEVADDGAWGHDLKAMARAVDGDTRVVFVANPNNPTGSFLPPAEVRAFLADVPETTRVVLDEAYYEYLAPEEQSGSETWLGEFPNLLVTRTFSKAWGLAGLRVGYGIGAPDLVDLLNRVRQPFNVNSLALVGARAALDDPAWVERAAMLNREERERMAASLDRLGIRWLPSRGNFLAVDVGDGAAAFAALNAAGVIVRPLGGYGMPAFIRVTIGLPEENDRFIAALRAFRGKEQ